ncbi:hypothetical protein GMLC_16630 [Geomonas limicola]|uniref:Lipoprotein n=1 Tax=Geomonas limicola TaxID=2740186 RepID=A0A6V8N814_9BACT|nr:hypothetical protein [Geomonas limicola]GFO68084.1 hypothetical protein GMLC_16630 [Geomonas limicola]
MRFVLTKILLPVLLLALFTTSALAAVGCDLNNPDRDVPRLFPESTSFKTVYVSIQKLGGPALLKKIENRLGAQSIALYAPVDVPYTLYEIYKDKKKVGYIHGVNQKGQFGGIQVFIAQDLTGKVKTFYLQKITGASASKFREAKFARKFEGVTLKDFDHYDPVRGKGTGRVAEVPNPSPELETDYYGILRGLKKNLVLMDEFVFAAERAKP